MRRIRITVYDVANDVSVFHGYLEDSTIVSLAMIRITSPSFSTVIRLIESLVEENLAIFAGCDTTHRQNWWFCKFHLFYRLLLRFVVEQFYIKELKEIRWW